MESVDVLSLQNQCSKTQKMTCSFRRHRNHEDQTQQFFEWPTVQPSCSASGRFQGKAVKKTGWHDHFERAQISHQNSYSTFWSHKHCFFIHVLPTSVCPSPCLVGEIFQDLCFHSRNVRWNPQLPQTKKIPNITYELVDLFNILPIGGFHAGSPNVVALENPTTKWSQTTC